MKHVKKPQLSHKLAAGIFAGMATAPFLSTQALAQVLASPTSATQDFTLTTDAITTSASKIPNLISTVAFVAGIGMAIAGVFKIKAHVDNPAQAPLKDGLIRLAVGGALLAFPLLTNLMVSLVGQDSATGHLQHTQMGNVTYP